MVYLGCLPASGVDGIWGAQSANATAAAQRKLGIPDDGIWGDQTDAAVREHIYSGAELPDAGEDVEAPATGTFWDHIRYWSREEFRCRCGEYHTPYCNGFPVEPDQTLVELADDVRAYFGRPGHRSSGIRCQQHNADQPNSATNSKHLYRIILSTIKEETS